MVRLLSIAFWMVLLCVHASSLHFSMIGSVALYCLASAVAKNLATIIRNPIQEFRVKVIFQEERHQRFNTKACRINYRHGSIYPMLNIFQKALAVRGFCRWLAKFFAMVRNSGVRTQIIDYASVVGIILLWKALNSKSCFAKRAF